MNDPEGKKATIGRYLVVLNLSFFKISSILIGRKSAFKKKTLTWPVNWWAGLPTRACSVKLFTSVISTEVMDKLQLTGQNLG